MPTRQELWLRARRHATAASFFFTAFVPAWIILLIRHASAAHESLAWAVPLALLAVAVPAAVLARLRRLASAPGEKDHVDVRERTDIARDVAMYTLSYLPVVLIDIAAPRDALVLVALVAVVYILYVKAGLLHINPVVAAFYRTYRVVDRHGNVVTVLSRIRIRPGAPIPCREVSDNLYVAVDGDG